MVHMFISRTAKGKTRVGGIIPWSYIWHELNFSRSKNNPFAFILLLLLVFLLLLLECKLKSCLHFAHQKNCFTHTYRFVVYLYVNNVVICRSACTQNSCIYFTFKETTAMAYVPVPVEVECRAARFGWPVDQSHEVHLVTGQPCWAQRRKYLQAITDGRLLNLKPSGHRVEGQGALARPARLSESVRDSVVGVVVAVVVVLHKVFVPFVRLVLGGTARGRGCCDVKELLVQPHQFDQFVHVCVRERIDGVYSGLVEQGTVVIVGVVVVGVVRTPSPCWLE